MADFLLELLSEEIPARMQANARNELARMFAECTGEAGQAVDSPGLAGGTQNACSSCNWPLAETNWPGHMRA